MPQQPPSEEYRTKERVPKWLAVVSILLAAVTLVEQALVWTLSFVVLASLASIGRDIAVWGPLRRLSEAQARSIEGREDAWDATKGVLGAALAGFVFWASRQMHPALGGTESAPILYFASDYPSWLLWTGGSLSALLFATAFLRQRARKARRDQL